MWLENLGFVPEGDGWKMTEKGATALDGELPVNMSGGVLSSNPIGASGMLRFRSEEHTSELQSQSNLVCRLLLEKKKEALGQLSLRAFVQCAVALVEHRLPV